MSAAAQLPPPQSKQISGFCPVGLSYFERLLSLNRPSEILVFSLVMVETIGRPGHPTWAEISDEQFERATNVSREQYLDALNTLINFSYVISRRNERGRNEYKIADTFRNESEAKRVHGKCPHCRHIFPIDQAFIPIPHIVFRKLGACLDPASFSCLMVILRYTLHYAKDRGVFAIPAEININDFIRLTTYEASSITKALAKLCDEDGYALIQRKERKGKPAIYCPALDRLYQMERREARVVVMPTTRQKGERSSKPEAPAVVQITEPNPESNGNESTLNPYGFCKTCDKYVEVEPVSESEYHRQQDESPPRAGPAREKREKPGKWEETKQAIYDLFVK